jgi:phage FluMu protein gp41
MEKNITDKFKHGLEIAGTKHFDFEVREATMADYFAAEAEMPAERLLSFDAALAVQTLVRVGTFKGPFTLALLGRLKPADFAALRKAMRQADTEGEPESGAAPADSTLSS